MSSNLKGFVHYGDYVLDNWIITKDADLFHFHYESNRLNFISPGESYCYRCKESVPKKVQTLVKFRGI